MSQTIQTHNSQDIDYRYIESVIQDLQHHGYDVISNPSTKDLPFDLGHYFPDLVAFKDGGGMILEVRNSAARLSVDRLQTVAETVAAHDGWKFRLLTSKDIPEYAVDGHANFPSWSSLQSKIENVEILIQNGMVEPALLYLWSIFESMLRKRAIAQYLPIDGYPPDKLFNHMYSSGEISMDEFDLFRALSPTRNKVTHGMATSIAPQSLQEAVRVMYLLIDQWKVDTD